jgi:hypothetical protein
MRQVLLLYPFSAEKTPKVLHPENLAEPLCYFREFAFVLGSLLTKCGDEEDGQEHPKPGCSDLEYFSAHLSFIDILEAGRG